jgi:hypothetical protein
MPKGIYKRSDEQIKKASKNLNPSNWKGKHFSEGHKQKLRKPKPEGFGQRISLKLSGEKSHHWKNVDIGYRGIHKWVERSKGKPKNCFDCGSTENLEWSNIDHKYNRNLDDYVARCKKCHRKYDKKICLQTNK